jgi:hypothetical protein
MKILKIFFEKGLSILEGDEKMLVLFHKDFKIGF